MCKELAKENSKDVTYDTLLASVTTKARTLVPDAVKKELLQKIKSQLLAQEEKLNLKWCQAHFLLKHEINYY